jgi:hypothetical protein
MGLTYHAYEERKYGLKLKQQQQMVKDNEEQRNG